MNARSIVMQRVAGRARRYPDLDATSVEVEGMSARDAGLARAIDHAVARRWLTLTAVLRYLVEQPWKNLEPRVQSVLLVGAAQLLLLDRLPDHAVINEGVEWIKRRRPKAGGLVNAVLRRVASLRVDIVPDEPFDLDRRDRLPLGDGRTWQLREAVFAATLPQRLSELTSNPESLIAHWSATLGWNRCCSLSMHGLVHPPIIVTGIAAADAVVEPELLPHDEPGFFVFTGEPDELKSLLARHSSARVQDPAAAAAAALLSQRPRPPETIIDYCAGRGTKTRQLAAMFPESRIIATDVDEARRTSLRESCAKERHITVVEPGEIRDYAGRADMLVLDVPCSNTGVLARRVEARYRFTSASLRRLIDLQRQIVADALPLLAPGGGLLYSTCSIERAENEEQARWICHWHRMKVSQSSGRLPAGLPGDPPTYYFDGGYAALLTPGG